MVCLAKGLMSLEDLSSNRSLNKLFRRKSVLTGRTITRFVEWYSRDGMQYQCSQRADEMAESGGRGFKDRVVSI